MSKIDTSAKFLNKVDYVVSSSLIGYGAYSSNWYILASGILGFIIAVANPTKKVLDFISKKFGAKKSKNASITSESLASKNQVYSVLDENVESTANQFLDIDVESPTVPVTPYSSALKLEGLYLKKSSFNIYTPQTLKISVGSSTISRFS